jgi:hypothetical protein
MLPNRALLLIHEFSKPLTKINWRKSRPIISTHRLYSTIRRSRMYTNVRKTLHNIILHNIEDTDWYYTCQYIQKYGLDKYYDEYFRQYGVKYDQIIHNVHAIEGVTDAINTFNWLHNIK